jgi:hypothetical protein
MAALGSALSCQLSVRGAWKQATRGSTSTRGANAHARSRAPLLVTAASTERQIDIQEVAAAVDSKLLLPKGLYCESHHQALRRPTRCESYPPRESGRSGEKWGRGESNV